jgi:hypothetical protein
VKLRGTAGKIHSPDSPARRPMPITNTGMPMPSVVITVMNTSRKVYCEMAATMPAVSPMAISMRMAITARRAVAGTAVSSIDATSRRCSKSMPKSKVNMFCR